MFALNRMVLESNPSKAIKPKKVRGGRDGDLETLTLFFNQNLHVCFEYHFFESQLTSELELWEQPLHVGDC